MVCIYCSSSTRVTNSRLQVGRNQIWRRRTCKQCTAVFTTHEAVDLEPSVVVEHSPRDMQAFSRDKLFMSIYQSCKHRKDPLRDSRALTNTVTSMLLRNSLATATLTREALIQTILAVLSRFDTTAATIYLAYHPIANPQNRPN